MPEDNLNPSSESVTEVPASPTHLAKPKNALAVFSLSLSIIALGAAGFSSWQWFNTSQASLQKSATLDQLSSITRINSTRLSHIQQQNRHLQNQVQALAQQNTSTSIALNEAADWVRAAQMSQLMNNTANAIQYLQQADQSIQALNNPKFQPIRSAINQDLNNLKNSPATDQEGLIIKLDALNQSIIQLPTAVNSKNPEIKNANQSNSANPYEPRSWKEKLLNSLAYLKDFVVIRHNSQLPILTPEQQELLKINIQFKLTETQWAVIQLKDALYQSNLKLISDMLQTYFVHSSEASSILNQISDLQQTHLQTNTAHINQSLDAIDEQLKQINNTPLAQPSVSPTTQAPQNNSNAATPSPAMPSIHHSVEA